MKFLSFANGGRASFGVIRDDGVIDLGRRNPDLADLRAAIRNGALPTLANTARDATADFSVDEVDFLPTLPNPEKVICIGVNYANRNEEYKDGTAAPKYPSVFMRTRESLVGHERADPRSTPESSISSITRARSCIVIGQSRAAHSREPAAHEHVAGLTVMNEGSVRDWLRHAKFNVTQGKNFAASGSRWGRG